MIEEVNIGNPELYKKKPTFHQTIEDFLRTMDLDTLIGLSKHHTPLVAKATQELMETISHYMYVIDQGSVIFQNGDFERMMFTKVPSDTVIEGKDSLVISRRFTGLPYVDEKEIV